ncbi:MAG: type IX secretion system membrane protein PorP/SprF [Clostridium sp.]|nr:type IX secretion system membrane protein PorP/SprF [Clostridium sp.]
MTHSVSRQTSRQILAGLIAAILFCVLPARAQTDAQFTQYYEIPAYYNPSALGLTDFVRIRGGARLQWVGIDNAPQTFAVMADSPLKIGKKRIGVGVVMEQNSEGLFSNMSIQAQGAYKLNLLKGSLSIGFGIGYRDQKFRGSKVLLPDDDDYHESTDNAIPTTDLSGSAIDFGVGAFYTHRLFWAGISCTHVNSPTITFSSGENGASTSAGSDAEGNVKNFEFEARRTLYFMAGSNIQIKNSLFEVMPSVFVKSDLTFTRVELNARIRYNKFLIAGIGYRYDDAITATIGAEFKNFFLGYSFDYPTSAIAKASSGSHEIVAGYSLKLDFSEKNKNRHKSIRIM